MGLTDITLTIPRRDREPFTRQVTAEQVSAHFALTPAITAHRRPDGETEFCLADSAPTLTHIPTGRQLLGHTTRVDIRRYAHALEALPDIDWSQVTDLDDDIRDRLRTVLSDCATTHPAR
ncbi:hypothetical protein [Nocardia asiatica]|uniref:hypothetical protein n=1 Tax=Nocardia asiatica TaxID=209252 RepID=UPI00031E9060|nr:hypothetical protein [Nocardia asiatica]